MDVLKSIVGGKTQIRCIVHDGTRKDLRNLDFLDLFEQEDGVWVPKDKTVSKEMITWNKITKRGQSWFMLVSLYGHAATPTASKVPSDITFGETRNPFTVFMVLADAPAYPADVRVLWNESDAQFDLKLKDGLAPHTVGENKRGVAFATTTDGDFLKRVSASYPTTAPYREIEYVLYARSTQTHVKASGSIVVDAVPADGDTFTLDDGITTALVFEFDDNSVITQGRAHVNLFGFTPGSTVLAQRNTIRDAIIATVNAIGSKLYISAAIGTPTDGKVQLTHVAGGTVGNTTIADGTAGDLTVVSFSGGTGAEGETGVGAAADGHKEIDNLPIKALCTAFGVDCGGQAEPNSQIGLRAILGLAPTIQGTPDRAYVHETLTLDVLGAGSQTAMKDYTGLTDLVTQDGYIASSEDLEVIDVSFSSSPVINVGNNTISVASAEQDMPGTLGFEAGTHERKYILLNGGTHAGLYAKIKKVVSSREVEVFDDLTANDATGSSMRTLFTGEQAFDGHVENEGLTEAPTNHSDPVGTVVLGGSFVTDDIAGGHVIGRVWNVSKNIKGVRIIVPAGMNKDHTPHKFKIQTLDPTANSNSPRPGFNVGIDNGDWIDLPASQHDYSTGSFQGDALYAAGQYGLEYAFTASIATKGVRVAFCAAFSASRGIQVGQLLAYEEPANITLVSDVLRFSVDNTSSWRQTGSSDLTPAVADVAATKDYQEIVDALNDALSGFQVEAVRSNFGFIWLRATVAGDDSDFDLDSQNNLSTLTTKLGFAVGVGTVVARTGVTQSILKKTVDAMTFILRTNLSGDHPQS